MTQEMRTLLLRLSRQSRVNKGPVLLWQGCAETGSITVPDIGLFTVFLVLLHMGSDGPPDGWQTPLIGIRHPKTNRIRGMGGFSNAAHEFYSYRFDAVCSGARVTIQSVTGVRVIPQGAVFDAVISKIYGLL